MWFKVFVLAILLGCFQARVVRLAHKREQTGGPGPGPGRYFGPQGLELESELDQPHSTTPALPPAKRFRPGKVVASLEEIRTRLFKDEDGQDDIASELRFIRKLGQGGYGTVYLAHDYRLNQTVACKTFAKYTGPAPSRRIKQLLEMSAKEKAFQEIYMLQHIPKHENLCQFLRYLEDDQRVVVVLEFCGGRSLLEFSEQFTPEQKIKHLFRQVVAGLKALHDNLVVHLDLKLANIMVNDREEVKIIDYSTSAYNQTTLGYGLGPGGYEAPECFLPGRKDGRKLDIWALGVGLYRLLFGYKPFGSDTSKEEHQQLMQYRFEFGARRVSEEVKDLIRHILVPAEQRLTLEQIQQHPWIKGE